MEDYSKYPRRYYKYAKLDKNAINCLLNSEFWFADPKTFNDPYDCRIEYDFECKPTELRNYLQKQNERISEQIKLTSDPLEQLRIVRRRKGETLSDHDCFSIIDRIVSKNGFIDTNEVIDQQIHNFEANPSGFYNIIQEASREEFSNFRVLSLSGINDCTTLWAHYSDNHHGICIELDLESDIDFFMIPVKVEYTKEYPRFNYITNWGVHNRHVKHVFSTKKDSWSYEKEYRIIKDVRETNLREGGLMKINRAAIKSISFGLKCSPSDIELVKNINEKFYSSQIELYQAKEITKSFNLGIRDLD